MKVQINNKQNVFFCSDPHFGHSGIVRGTSKWEGGKGTRDFDTLEEHDKALVDNINSTVGENDILFCLGDWSFGNYKNGENVTNIKKFRDQIKCKNIHLIFGNHDQEIRKDADRAKSRFLSTNDYLEIVVTDIPTDQSEKPLKYHIIMSHYSHRVWNKSHCGSWMLFGHSHANLRGVEGKSVDVGFDNHLEFKPFSFQELKEIMKNKEILKVDHHE